MSKVKSHSREDVVRTFIRGVILTALLSIVICLASAYFYADSQQTIEQKNNRVQSEILQMNYGDYKMLDEIDKERRLSSLEQLHQAKLLEMPLEEFNRLPPEQVGRLLESKALQQLGLTVTVGVDCCNPELSNHKLSSEQENALHQLWLGYPKVINFDKEYVHHGWQIVWWGGGGLFLLGLLLTSFQTYRAYRVFVDSRKMRQAL